MANFKEQVINVLGFAIPIALFIYALIEDEVIQRVICIFLLVGTPLLVFHFNLMLQIRKAAPKFHSTCLPLFIIYEQILVIFPIGGIFPVIACQLEIQELDYASFSQFQVVYSLLIFSFMMVFFVVFFLIVFNKYELFLKKTLVVKQMMQIFATYRIKATQKNCTFILDLFINDESKTVSSLLERELVAFEEVPIVLADQYKWELVKKYQQQKYQEQSESQSQILNQMEDVNIQNHNQTLKWTKKLINYFYQCLFCRIGKKQIMEFEKQQREIIVDLIELIQWKESKVYQEKFQQQNNNCKFLDYFEKFKKTSQNDVFYQKLKYDQSQQLKFWVSVYEIFQNDLTQFIDLMNWNIDHQVLEQYNFVSINQEATEINFENFVLLLNDHVQEYQEESVNNLWSFAILKYPLLISLCINLKEFIQTIQPKEFQYKQFFKKKQLRISQVGVLRQQLTCQNTETQDNVEEEYQENLKQIIKKKDSKNARELKCWKICFTIHKFLWMTPINFLKKHFACLSNSNFYTILGILPLKQKVEKDENLESEILNQIVQILEKSKQDRPNAEKEMNFNIKNQYKQWTTSDLIEYISRFYDYLTLFLMTIDFYFEFQFDVNLKFPTLFFNVIFLDFAAFQHTLIIACTVSVGYFIVGMIGLYLIIINKFDMNIEGQINYTWFSKVIKYILIVFGALYLNVMKIYMDAFICDYSNYPFTLIREPSIECFENKHWIYILIASTGSILYYLTSAFLKPVLQKYDFDLNLKYSSTYVVLYMQYQLLFVVVRSTFQHYQEQLAKIIQFIILLIFTMTLQFFFFIFENKWKLYFKIEFSVLCVISAIYCSLILKWWVPLGWNLAILIYIIFGAIAVFIRELQKIYRVHAWERNQNRNREF